MEDDLETQQTQINNTGEEVDLHDSQITILEVNDASQDERLVVVENDVDLWDDKITSLEVANMEITQRLITVEETLLGN